MTGVSGGLERQLSFTATSRDKKREGAGESQETWEGGPSKITSRIRESRESGFPGVGLLPIMRQENHPQTRIKAELLPGGPQTSGSSLSRKPARNAESAQAPTPDLPTLGRGPVRAPGSWRWRERPESKAGREHREKNIKKAGNRDILREMICIHKMPQISTGISLEI